MIVRNDHSGVYIKILYMINTKNHRKTISEYKNPLIFMTWIMMVLPKYFVSSLNKRFQFIARNEIRIFLNLIFINLMERNSRSSIKIVI